MKDASAELHAELLRVFVPIFMDPRSRFHTGQYDTMTNLCPDSDGRDVYSE